MKIFLLRILLMFSIMLFYLQTVNAQRFEVHAIKDLSTNEQAHKAWGAGGVIELDQLVKKTTFKAYFDWAMFKDKENENHSKYQRMSGGIIACFTHDFTDKFTVQCGGEINYSFLKHSYIYDYEPLPNDTTIFKPLTWLQTGNFIGLGIHVGVLYKLTPRFSVILNVAPTYLIPVLAKSSVMSKESEYKKGIWLFPIRLGISYQLFKKE